MKYYTWLALMALVACGQVKNNHKLPIFGNHDINGTDTVYHTVGDFRLINQDSVVVTPATYAGKMYVADFFFTSCPTICPVMKTQMLRVYESIEGQDDIVLVSHTIDPEHDTPALLKDYAASLGVNTNKWQFLHGAKDSIYALAQKYMIIANEDPNAPGGFAHSGAFLLVDGQARIRGVYDGTEPAQVDLLIKDIELLRKENE